MTAPTSDMAARLLGVTKRYRRGNRDVVALDDVSLDLPRGTIVSVTGASGSGKSTLLNLVAGLDTPSAGEIIVEGRSLALLGDDELTDLRRSRVGIVFQFFNLLPTLTALNNVALPLRGMGLSTRESSARAREALQLVGLLDRVDHRPMELSGGEMQRVAIARAFVIQPTIILADEPTGNLDSRTGADVLELLRRCNRDRGVTIVLVTHSPSAAAYGDRVLTLRDGRIVEDVGTRPPKEPRPRHLKPAS